MGETALLYAIWGKAKKVYSFEPVERLYATMVKNIHLNNLENKIIPIKALLVGKAGAYAAGNSFELSKTRVDKISLSEFVIKNSINDAVLKLDCEGGEYEIIKDTPESILKRFKILHIEYHYGYKDLIAKLKNAGFKVTYTKPTLSIVGMFSGVKYMGDIIAVREDAEKKT
jgi:FkbM family methyltransferase